MGEGAIFYFSTEISLKSAKNEVFSIFCLPMGGYSSPQPASCYATGVKCLSQGHNDVLPVRESNRESVTQHSTT